MVDTKELLFEERFSAAVGNRVLSCLSGGLDFDPNPMDSYELLRPSCCDDVSCLKDAGAVATTTVVSKSSSTESEYGIEPGCSTRLLDSDVKVIPQPLCNCPSSPFVFHSMRTPAHHHHHQNGNVMFKPVEVGLVQWNWPAIRLFCLIAFCTSVLALLCVVVGLLFGLRSDCLQEKEWWRGVVMYEVFPASFQDTDGDGFGDMKGVLQRIPYVQSLGVRVVRFNSLFSALDYPLEYEHVIDFMNVDPHLGRIEQFEHVVRELHRRDIRVVLDINPTVTSDQHTWAAHWLLNSYSDYEGFYVNVTEYFDEFYPQKVNMEIIDLELPQRIFGGQVFLNWTNRQVQREMRNVLKYWFRKGVDGFYFKHLERIQVVSDYEQLEILQQWRQLADMFGQEGRSRMLMCSLDYLESLRARQSLLLSAAFEVFDLVDVSLELSPNVSADVEQQLRTMESWVKEPGFPAINWNMGSSENFRMASRLTPGYNLAALFLLTSLPGSATIFYGDEIQLQDAVDEMTQKIFRSGQLCPMQWSPYHNSNFTLDDSLPWLPLQLDYKLFNVANQSQNIATLALLIHLKNGTYPLRSSHLSPHTRAHLLNNSTHNMSALNCNLLFAGSDGSLVMERYYPRHPRFVVCANFGDSDRQIDLSNEFHSAQVRLATSARLGDKSFNQLLLQPGEALVAEVLE